MLVDLAAQTHEPLVKWIESSSLLDAEEELGVSLTYWHVMDSGRDSVDLLRTLLDRFGGRMSYVIVLNQVRGDDFAILEASGEKRARARPRRPLRDRPEAAGGGHEQESTPGAPASGRP